MSHSTRHTMHTPFNQRDMCAQLPRKTCPKDKHGSLNWSASLPKSWQEAVIPPFSFKQQSEYELPASKTIGYDIDDTPCYYRHTYVLRSLCSDDDDEFYEVLTYGEEVEAWRLRDERWLIWRIIHEDGGCHANRGFFSFSEDMPK